MATSENAPPSPSPSGKRSLSDKSWLDYLWIIREHWILALLFAACLASFYAYRELQTIPLYRSVATLLYEPQQSSLVNIDGAQSNPMGRGAEMRARNHLTDLRSNAFRSRVVDSFSEEEAALIRAGYGSQAEAEPTEEENEGPSLHGIIAGSNKISLIGGNIFRFEFHHRDPEAAALLANRYAEEFKDFLLERAPRANESALRFLRSQSEELKLKVERAELAVQQYRQERNLVSLEESQNLIVERMKNLSGSLNEAKVQLLNLSATMEEIDEAGDDFEALAKLPAINQMGTLPAKFEERSNLLAQRKKLSLRYGQRHPRMIENEANLEGIEEDIRTSLRKNVSDLRQEYRTMQNRVENLEEALAEAEKESLQLDQTAIEYNVLRRKLETDKRLFSQVHQRLNEAMLASQLTNSELRMIDRAWPASEPFTPDNKKIYTMTGFLFLLGFCGVPYGIHYLNLKLKTATDIEQQLQVPFLGEIRKFPRRLKNLHRLVLRQTDPQGAEFFRQLHSQILLKNRQLHPGHTFVIASALPKEGKSFLAINLAASFGRHHYKTLLMDCDFRRPTLANRLRKEVEQARATQHDSSELVALDENLHFLPASKTTVEATEWIESREFRDQLHQLQSQYDIVIIDTPPSGLFPDAGIIGNHAHHFLFLTQLNKHRKTFLKAILNRLDESQAELLGVIANKVSRSKSRNLGAYRYADYKKYKSYYNTPEPKPQKT